MRKLGLTIIMLTAMLNSYAQTQFWSDTFEDTGAPSSGTRTPSAQNSTGSPATSYFFRTNNSGIALQNVSGYSNVQGSKFWAAEDIDAAGGTQNGQSPQQTITWSGINISGKSSLSFKGLFAANDVQTSNFEGTNFSPNEDRIVIEARIDGGAWTKILAFYCSSIASGVLKQDTDGDLVGDGTTLTYTFGEFSANISGTGSSLDLRMTMSSNNSVTEEIAVDNFRLFEVASTSTTWNGSTWSGGTPTASLDAIIASNTTPGNFTCKNLTINSGVALTMATGTTANINGNVTNNGNGFSGTGTFNFASTGALSGNAISTEGTITVATGVTLTTNGNLTLASNATNTGSIGNSAGSISGNVTVQRYIPGKRAFRFLGHPLSASQALTTLTDNIDITGSGGSSNGFTTTSTNNPSAFWFDVSAADNTTSGNNPGWTAFTNTNGTGANSWDQYELIRVLVRGTTGQGLSGGSYSPSAVTLDMTGTINQGTQVVTLTKGSGSNFVSCGNPFPSPVNMQNVSKGANIGANYYAWDATSGVAGAYVTNAFSLSYNLPAFSAIFTTASANSSNTLTFEEADKASSGAGVFKTTAPANWVELIIEDSTIHWDRLLINLDDNAMSVQDNMDGEKLYNPGLDFFTLTDDNIRLAVDVRPYNDGNSIPIGLTAYNRYNKYVIKTGMFDIPTSTKLFLYDKYLNKKEELKAGVEYWFDVTSDTLSQGNNRFEINMVGKPTGIAYEEVTDAPEIQLIPNPAQSSVKVAFDNIDGTAQVKLVSLTGQTIFNRVIENGTGSIIIPLQNIPSGTYIVNLQSKNATFTEKLIKE